MRTANRILSVLIASLFLVGLVPTPAGGAGLISDGQQDVAKPSGVVGKMLEEVDLFLHTDPITLGPGGWPEQMAQSILGGAPPSATYKQVTNPVATFAAPTQYKTVEVLKLGEDPSGEVYSGNLAQALEDTPTDINNKRVRIGQLANENNPAPSTSCPTPNPAAPLPQCPSGIDINQQLSFFTPASLTAQSDFWIYDIRAQFFAICGVVTNGVFTADSNVKNGAIHVADLRLDVYRINPSGAREQVGNPLADDVRTIRLGAPLPASSDPATHILDYTGNYVTRANTPPLVATTPSNFFDNGGWKIKAGERLEFRISVASVSVASPASAGKPYAPDSDFGVVPNGECFLHYDTIRTSPTSMQMAQCTASAGVLGKCSNGNKYYDGGLLTPGPGQQTVRDEAGYASKIKIIGDSLRASTWFEDKNGQPAVGLGNGDSFNLATMYASSWGGLAQAKKEDQPKALDGRVGQQFRRIKDFTTGSFFGAATSTASRTVVSDSVLVTREPYSFGSFAQENLGDYRSELFVKEDLQILDLNFKGASIAVSPAVGIGKTGMGFGLASGEKSMHLVNPGEKTVFSFSVSNLGSSPDTISVVADAPGSGWTAEVLNGLQTVGGGGTATVNVVVTPPSTALAGAVSPPIIVRAISSFADIIPPATAPAVSVTIVSGVAHAINLTSATSSVALRPSETRLIGVSLRNAGTALENVLLTASLPQSASGWSVKVLPTGKPVYSGATGDFQIELRAPNQVDPDVQFNLVLTGTLVGVGGIQSEITIPVKVVGKYGISATIFPRDLNFANLRQEAAPREEGPIVVRYNPREPTGAADPVPGEGFRCVGVPAAAAQAPTGVKCLATSQDPTYTGSIQIPILLENKGSLPDTLNINRPTDPSLTCSTSDGSWTYRMQEYGSLSTSGSKAAYLLPAQSKKLVMLEMTPCTSSHLFTPTITLQVVSSGDPSQKTSTQTIKVVPFAAGTQSAKGRFSNSAFGVELRSAPGQETTVLNTAPGAPATYQLLAQNIGNQRDNLTIRVNVPPAGSGWTQSISFVNSSYGGDNGFCTQVSDYELKCGGALWTPTNTPPGRTGVRVGEIVQFAVKTTPSTFVPVGTTFPTTVAVASGSDGTKTSTMPLTTTATGTHVFLLSTPTPVYDVERGGIAMLPFTISNIGTSGDSYALALTAGDASFAPRLSLTEQQFVPAGKTLHGFVAVAAPANATLGQANLFRVNVLSNGSSLVRTVDLYASPVAASNLRVQAIPSGDILLPNRTFAHPIKVEVRDLAGRNGMAVNVSVDGLFLPPGWDIQPRYQTVSLATDGPNGTKVVASFTAKAPEFDLGVSRLPIRFTARNMTTPAERGFADVVFQLASSSGLTMTAPLGASGVTAPGADFVYKLNVRNGGSSNEPTAMSSIGVPEGWSISYNPASFNLGPLQIQSVDATVRSPISATPRTIAPIVAVATAASGAVSQQLLSTVVGYYGVNVTRVDNGTAPVAPGEAATFIIKVGNNGTLTGDFSVAPGITATQYATAVTVPGAQILKDVKPGETRDVTLRYVAALEPPAGAQIGLNVSVRSLSLAGPSADLEMAMRILDYKALDADGDGIAEYAVDADGIANGYESFRESSSANGKQSASLQMVRYLNNASLARHTVAVANETGNLTNITTYMLDGDSDGRVDHFIDSVGNLLPDRYWDPDSGIVSVINITKDINADDIPDFFVDRDGDGAPDGVYDLTTGNWTQLRRLDIDGDGQPDYLVDLDGDNKVGKNETVLYLRGGKLLTVQKIDLDGDGTPDDVWDVDGDGRADSFILAGSDKSIPIVYRDVTNDKVLDWTYDLNGDGREETYYDPTTMEVHTIDNKGLFFQSLKDNWYIGAMFGLVILLFAVLIGVTRRG